MRRVSSRRAPFSPWAGVNTALTLRASGAVYVPPRASVRTIFIVVVGCSPARVTATLYLPQLVSIGWVLTSERAMSWMRVEPSPLSLKVTSSSRRTTVSTEPRLRAGSIARGAPLKVTVPVKGCEPSQKKPAGIGSCAKLVLAKPATVIHRSTPLWTTSAASTGDPAINIEITAPNKAERIQIFIVPSFSELVDSRDGQRSGGWPPLREALFYGGGRAQMHARSGYWTQVQMQCRWSHPVAVLKGSVASGSQWHDWYGHCGDGQQGPGSVPPPPPPPPGPPGCSWTKRGLIAGPLSTAGSTPARKFEVAGRTVSGLPSPLVSMLTPAGYCGVVTYAQTEWLPGPSSMRRVSSRRGPFFPRTGVDTALSFGGSGAVLGPPRGAGRVDFIVVVGLSPATGGGTSYFPPTV